MLNFNVLLLGGGLQSLSVAASLKQEGCVVSALISHDIIAFSSRFIDYKRNFPDIENEDVCKAFMIDFLKKRPQHVIIPMGDKMADFLSKNKTLIETYHVKCAVPDYDIFITANDKWNLMKLCKKYQIGHPKTVLLSSETINYCAEYVGFPSLIKPNFSVGARGITLVNNIDELRDKYQYIYKEFGDCTLQEFIKNPGYYYSVMLYRDSMGVFHNYTIIKILRFYPIQGGSSSYCETVTNQKLLDLCQKTLDMLHWVGFADFDVMEDANTSEYKILEINPRVPASLRAAAVSNVNFPAIIVADVLGMSVPEYDYMEGKALRYLGLDILWFIKSPDRFMSKPSFFRFIGRNVFCQDGSLQDPLPLITSFASGLLKCLHLLFNVK
ncbi:MAG: ATP-grasp domain-containing protein [Bacteroidales bacterium]|nr:ATP-grasp domain-containing protein [Bacteroidales bacterium]